ncbi:hypothetical protein F2Q68_00014093 [Brassica cretica]|uniref:Uncharacterized protein n=1 Tax=Brassica cretica TaxID=69181 RepID=A0A8S9HFU7_BRACR|nr:hypothetical protein F2Q68_00014093 [Brassica cretica]
MTTLDHSTCSLTGTVSSRLIVGVHLEVSHRRLNRPLEEMVLVYTAHLKAHQHPGHYVGSVYGYGWGSPGRCYQNGSGQDGSGGGGGSSSSMNGMPVFDQYAVNRYFINQTVCPAFVIIFKRQAQKSWSSVMVAGRCNGEAQSAHGSLELRDASKKLGWSSSKVCQLPELDELAKQLNQLGQ